MSPDRSDSRSGRDARSLLYPVALVLLGCGVYLGALSAPFHFDDDLRIVREPAVQRLWPIGGHPNRPVLMFSLALNRALFGMEPLAFRSVNVAIHVAAALFLLGIVRRVLRGPRFAERCSSSADALAFACASLWVVHPLHTQAVTYVWQRGESLMGMFFLATVYCVVRAAGGARGVPWCSAAALAFLFGLGTKEVMVAALPTLVVVDGLLLAPSVREALRRRWGFYAPLAALVLFLVVAVLPRTKASYEGASPLEYAASQPGVVLDYLRLALWPHPLCFDYGRAPAEGLAAILAPSLVVGPLLAATLLALKRRLWLGVAGAWFFCILAPTSSFLPINDLMVEYRMYLPLAAVVAVVAGGGLAAARRARLPSWLPLSLVLGAVGTLGTLTVLRNRDYRSNVALWQSTVAVAPDNPRAHSQLAIALAQEGRPLEAYEHARKAAELAPESPQMLWNLGFALQALRRDEEALERYKAALRLRPHDAEAHSLVAQVLLKLGRLEDAVSRYERSIGIRPDSAEAHAGLATALERLGWKKRAVAASRKAVELDPGDAASWRRLGRLLSENDDGPGAIAAYERALEIEPDHAWTRDRLAAALLAEGRVGEAAEHAGAAADSPSSRTTLGLALQQAGRWDEARVVFERLVNDEPDDVTAHLALARVLLELDRPAEAAESYRRAFELDAASAEAHAGLGTALERLQRYEEALRAYAEATRIEPANTSYWRLRGRLSVELNRRPDAIQAYERAIALDPENPELHHDLGLAYAGVGRHEAALEHLAEALRREPSLAVRVSETALRVATASGSSADRRLARSLGELAVEVTDRRAPEVLANLARILVASGRDDLARGVLETLLALPEIPGRAAYERELRELKARN